MGQSIVPNFSFKALHFSGYKWCARMELSCYLLHHLGEVISPSHAHELIFHDEGGHPSCSMLPSAASLKPVKISYRHPNNRYCVRMNIDIRLRRLGLHNFGWRIIPIDKNNIFVVWKRKILRGFWETRGKSIRELHFWITDILEEFEKLFVKIMNRIFSQPSRKWGLSRLNGYRIIHIWKILWIKHQ